MTPLAVNALTTLAQTRGVSGGPGVSGVDVQPSFRYCVYGIDVTSDTPLALPNHAHATLGHVECRTAPAAFFAPMSDVDFDPRSDGWYQFALLADGATYVRWNTVGEFLVAPDGYRITSRRFDEASTESFQVYLLGQALSFALVKQHIEPLHATAVVVEDQAVAFLGNNGFGKSTLAACFLEAGYRVLTDDLLVLTQSGGRIVAYPGAPRIKLFRSVAQRFLRDAAAGVPMHADAEKLVLPVDDASYSIPVPLRAMYSLAPPSDLTTQESVRIDTLSRRESFLELVKGTFNRRHVKAERLERHFSVMAQLSAAVSVKRLAYPRAMDRLPDIRSAVLADLA